MDVVTLSPLGRDASIAIEVGGLIYRCSVEWRGRGTTGSAQEKDEPKHLIMLQYFRSLEIIGDMHQDTEAFCRYS